MQRKEPRLHIVSNRRLPRIFITRRIHSLPEGYRRTVLVMYLAGAKQGPEGPLDVAYALRKLKRWMVEGPTERNKKMVQFILSKGNLGPFYSGGRRGAVPENTLLLIDLAVEWNDFTMWAAVLEKSGGSAKPQLLGSTHLIRAWNAFPFNITRPTLVPSRFLSPRCIPRTHDSHFESSLQIRKTHSLPAQHEDCGRVYQPPTVFPSP